MGLTIIGVLVFVILFLMLAYASSGNAAGVRPGGHHETSRPDWSRDGDEPFERPFDEELNASMELQDSMHRVGVVDEFNPLHPMSLGASSDWQESQIGASHSTGTFDIDAGGC